MQTHLFHLLVSITLQNRTFHEELYYTQCEPTDTLCYHSIYMYYTKRT